MAFPHFARKAKSKTITVHYKFAQKMWQELGKILSRAISDVVRAAQASIWRGQRFGLMSPHRRFRSAPLKFRLRLCYDAASLARRNGAPARQRSGRQRTGLSNVDGFRGTRKMAVADARVVFAQRRLDEARRNLRNAALDFSVADEKLLELRAEARRAFNDIKAIDEQVAKSRQGLFGAFKFW
jgi:hypothetical protein